ncbi:MAG: glycosyl hydrolase family 18 protein [bacterium]
MLSATILAFSLLGSPGAPSVHQREAERQRVTPRVPAVPRAAGVKHGRPKAVVRVVYGYYRGADPFLANVRWEALTHLAWFSVGLDEFGGVTGTNGWPDDTTVQAAHAANVRVDLTFTLFDTTAIGALLADPARRATAITNMVDLLEQGGADGLSIDFETPPGSARADFVAFCAELRAELDGRGLTTAEITIAGPSVDWNGAIDLGALLDHVDYYFIMGYGYFYSGSGRAGPTGLLRITADWAPYANRSALRSIADFSLLIPAHKRRQIIYGVPWYGVQWTTASGDVGAAAGAFDQYRHYKHAREDLFGGQSRLWHDGIKSPWYTWQDAGGWHQVWYEDEESLAHKYQLALDQDLAGVGMWVIDSAGMYPELWDGLEDALSVEPTPPPGHRANPIPIDVFPFHDARDTTAGPSSYFNFYSCDTALPEFGREWVYRVDVCQPGILAAHVPEDPAIDPDLHLLSAADQDACLARAHLDLTYTLAPGRYLLTVDTWVDADGVELEGPYTLDVTFTPEAGSEGCAAHLRCNAGSCECADPALTDCGSACVDTQSDDAHCGGCGSPCTGEEHCENGACVSAPTGDAGVDAAADASELPCCDDCSDQGCGCRAGGTPDGGFPVVALLLLVGGLLRRRRRG